MICSYAGSSVADEPCRHNSLCSMTGHNCLHMLIQLISAGPDRHRSFTDVSLPVCRYEHFRDKPAALLVKMAEFIMAALTDDMNKQYNDAVIEQLRLSDAQTQSKQ